MHRLLVSESVLQGECAELSKEAAHHLKVLRPREGEALELFDGRGHVRAYVCRSGGIMAAGPVREVARRTYELVLFACITKGNRWDWTIEKAVELGVAKIVPVISERVIVRLPPSERAAKRERWQRLAQSAATQSHSAWVPEVMAAVDFSAALVEAQKCACVFTGALTEPLPPPMVAAVDKLAKAGNVAGSWGVFIGPEGDFTPGELGELLKVSQPVSFGPAVLRAETAAIFALSVLSANLEAMYAAD